MSGHERAWNPARIRVLYDLNRAAMRYWRAVLDKTPHAMDYLAARGFAEPEAVADRYGIGYAPTRTDSRPGFVHEVLRRGFEGTEKGEDLERALVAAGLATRPATGGGLRDFMYGRLVFPIAARGTLAELTGPEAVVVGFGGRRVPSGESGEDGDGPPKWLNTREGAAFTKRQILYGLSWAHDALLASRDLVLLEGYLDVIQVREAGFATAVATLGTALTDEHVSRLPTSTRTKTLTVYLSTDDDDAGRASAVRSAELLFRTRPDARVRIAHPTGGLDPDDLIRTHGAAAFQAVLDQALTPARQHLSDLGRRPSDGVATLRSLVEIVQDVRGLLSPSAEDRREDLDALQQWLEQHYGALIPVHTLRRVLEGTP